MALGKFGPVEPHVAGRGVEVELGGIERVVVVRPLRIWQRFQGGACASHGVRGLRFGTRPCPRTGLLQVNSHLDRGVRRDRLSGTTGVDRIPVGGGPSGCSPAAGARRGRVESSPSAAEPSTRVERAGRRPELATTPERSRRRRAGRCTGTVAARRPMLAVLRGGAELEVLERVHAPDRNDGGAGAATRPAQACAAREPGASGRVPPRRRCPDGGG